MKRSRSQSNSQRNEISQDEISPDEEVVVIDYQEQSVEEELETQLWAQKHEPKFSKDLAVHKKKITQVSDWLKQAFTRNTPQLLILLGPTGAAKTTTVKALLNEMDVELVEWENPVHISTFVEGQNYTSIGSAFSDVIRAATKRTGLSFNVIEKVKSKRVFVVEDIPSVANANRAAIHLALESFVNATGKTHPLIIIMSEIASNSKNDSPVNLRQLCPSSVTKYQGTHQITFNPVAKTILIKALTRICDLEFKIYPRRKMRPSKSIIEMIADSCGGDIRAAIHTLQFNSICPLKGGTASSRDIEANLFSALGKVLYNKRKLLLI